MSMTPSCRRLGESRIGLRSASPFMVSIQSRFNATRLDMSGRVSTWRSAWRNRNSRFGRQVMSTGGTLVAKRLGPGHVWFG